MSTFFVTGTDTDAGKTLVTSALLYQARTQGLGSLGLKPIASGCEETPEGLRNADALALQAQSYPTVDYATVNRWAFAPAIAPHIAAAEVGVPLTTAEVVEHLETRLTTRKEARLDSLTLIEGAGGWYVPLNAQESLADVVKQLALPVVLVVGLKLGCLNHALLSARAIHADGLHLAGWVGSAVDGDFAAHSTRFTTTLTRLHSSLNAPCLGVVPHLAAPNAATASAYLSVAPLLSAPPQRRAP